MGEFLKENYKNIELESNLIGLKSNGRIYCEYGEQPDLNKARVLKDQEKKEIEKTLQSKLEQVILQ